MKSSTIAWTVGCSLLALVGPAEAQGPLDLTCHPIQVDLERAAPSDAYWLARYPKSVTATAAQMEAEGRWEDAVAYIVELFRGDFETLTGAGGLFAAAEQFRDSVAADLAAARTSGVAGSNAFIVQEIPPSTPNDPTLYAAFNNSITVRESDDAATQRSICWLSHSLRRFNDRLDAPGRRQSELQLRARVERWNTFNDRGLTPYPWELVLNELVDWFGSRSALEPPNVQMIALRPAPAVEVETDFDNRTNVAAVELLGVIAYVNNRTWYLGGSLLWTSPTEAPSGLGAMIHVAPWLKGGPVWRDVDGDGSRDFRWTLSLDAFDLLKGAPQSLLQAAREATGGRAGG